MRRAEAEVPRLVYTVLQFCKQFHIHRNTLYRWWDEGVGPRYFQVTDGGRRYMSITSIEEWMAERESVTAELNTKLAPKQRRQL